MKRLILIFAIVALMGCKKDKTKTLKFFVYCATQINGGSIGQGKTLFVVYTDANGNAITEYPPSNGWWDPNPNVTGGWWEKVVEMPVGASYNISTQSAQKNSIVKIVVHNITEGTDTRDREIDSKEEKGDLNVVTLSGVVPK